MTQEPEILNSEVSSGGRQTVSEPHLHSHGHLTHNIHLRNLHHMQRHRVLMEARNSAELPLMKELTILRRARSLRDPSTSPAWSNSSYGSRRIQGNGTKRDEAARETRAVGSDARRDMRKLNLRGGDSTAGKREKLDLRAGGHHWVGEFLGEDASDLQASCPGSDQKENHVLKSNGLKDGYHNHQIVEEREAKSTTKGGSKNKKGRRLEKSRSYPRGGYPEEEDEQSQKSQKRSGRSTDQHSERENMPDGSILGERVAIDEEKLQRGSIRVVENGYVEEPERRAAIARRVISETRNGDGVRGAEGSDSRSGTRLSSPVFVPKAVTATAATRSRREHLDLLSVMNLAEHEGGEREQALEGCGGESAEEAEEEDEVEEEEEEEINGRVSRLKQLPSSLSSHTHSPLLYRDSMTVVLNERSTPRARRKATKVSGSRDGERRHREGINLRVTGKPPGRLRGRRPGLRPSLSSNSNGGSSFGMEGELEVSELPRNGCGIPWYWTRIHKYRGKRFLDMAGRSLACGITEGPKRKEDIKLDSRQCRSNSHRDLIRSDHLSLSLGRSSRGGERSSDFEPSSRRDGCESPEIPRADGNLLTGDRSGELVFGSTREELSGVLVPASPGFGDGSPPGLPRSIDDAGDEPNCSLSEKYRPRAFSELVGQSLVTKSLSTAILKGKIAPVYLFQGPRGTGKSSAARIFALALNCLSDNAELTRPCGFCIECTNSSPDIREFDATSNNGVDSVKALLGSMLVTPSTSRSRVFIIDDCHCLTAEAWSTFLKALEKPPWHVVFILITTDADKVPRTATSRCQKFLFSKIKEVEIVSRLQSLARQEGLEVEESALALVAARSQGSLRDAETVLDQLSLLGRKISLSMVQEMVGLVSDEKLIELLDLAMSAEAVSTVRCMRELLDGGVEPLALVSQLATLITDILAGTYVVARDKLNRGFFFRRSSKKEEAVRLRQALKILSEAEKQLRLSSDQPTWLTAALLQFAPDRSFQPSSLETSVVASPIAPFNDTSEKETVGDSFQPWTSEEQIQCQPEGSKGELSSRRDQGYPLHYLEKRKKNGTTSSCAEAKIHPAESPVICTLGSPDDRASGRPSNARSDTPLLPGSIDDLSQRDFTVMSQRKLEEVWQRVLHGSRSNVLRQLLQGQGKLLSLLLSDAFAVAHLEFRQPEHKARAERSRSRICNAFQMALGCPVELQITLACMPGEHQLSFTSFDDQQPIFDGWHKEKARTPDKRVHEVKSTVQHRRRQRGSRIPRHTESMDISQSLYNAVMGDSKGFKPEILPVVSSSRWGRHGPDCRQEDERSDRSREVRTYSVPLPQELRTRYGPALIARGAAGKVPLKAVIHQYDDTLNSPHQDSQTEVLCGSSSSRRKSVKFKNVNSGHATSLDQEKVRLESRLKPSQTESRLLCWRLQRLDEDKIKVQRRRRQRREEVSRSRNKNSSPTESARSLRKEGCLSSVREKLRCRSELAITPIAHKREDLRFQQDRRITPVPEKRDVPEITPDERPWNFHYNESYDGSGSSELDLDTKISP